MRCTAVDWFNYDWRVTERFVKMPRTFTHEEYADMVYVYGYCNGNANAAVDEYRRRYPLQRTPNRAVLEYYARPETSSTVPIAQELTHAQPWQ